SLFDRSSYNRYLHSFPTRRSSDLKKLSLKQFGVLVIILTAFFFFTDQTTNLVKYGVGRLRPVNDPDILPQLRYLRGANSPSFFSGHASNYSGSILLIFLFL